jgi:hypothetical protein
MRKARSSPCWIRVMIEYGIWGLLKHLLDRADEIFVDAYQTAVGRQLELLALLGLHDASLENHRAVGSQVDGRRVRRFAVFPYEFNSKFHLNLHEDKRRPFSKRGVWRDQQC